MLNKKNRSGQATAELERNGFDALNTLEEPRILKIDPWIEPYKQDIMLRMKQYIETKNMILQPGGRLTDFANGHFYFGFHRTNNGWYYREWAPNAEALYLIGDFNNWDREAHPLTRKEDGVWEVFLPGKGTLKHQSRVKVFVVANGIGQDRIPLYITRVIQDPETHDFSGQIWKPYRNYRWQDQDFKADVKQPLLIYEAHIGMAQEKEEVGTYLEFADMVLPVIKELGYNTVQLMGLMEHPYYGSFGYHVSNFYAASSRFGTPDELKELIDRAHQMGISVLMDCVHSHAVKNFNEGINGFDGTEYQFFHSGERGDHQAWDSKLFDYGKPGVIHFLLSNLKFWLEEYHLDGFRFDGVTSMIYQDHGLGTHFDAYNKYFSLNTDLQAVTYLQLANELVKEVKPEAISVAEDMSGMPGMCLPIEDGGIGFDYRLAMGMPDFWFSTLKRKDEEWSMHALWYEMTTRREGEKRIGYVESHDQALVGDKTLMFTMADQEMYWNMNREIRNHVIDRALALHKMIRLITISSGAEGYLNFMGNEFGHPEWVDFPRPENNLSYQYCRRQWSLAEKPELFYGDLKAFDGAMVKLMKKEKLMGEKAHLLWLSQEKKVIAYRKKKCVFIFNFHPTDSYEDLEIPIHKTGSLQVILDTDEAEFGGFSRISDAIVYETKCLKNRPEDQGISIYVPSRTAMVLKIKAL